jgi:membrane-bound ClpP family serine protease
MEWYLLVALALIVIGAGVLLVEFILPTGGILVVVAVALFASAVGLVFLYGSTLEGVISIVGLSIGLPVAGSIMFAGWKKLSLKSALDTDANTSAEATEVPSLEGVVGKTLSPMRPSGIVDFDGRRVDAMSQGPLIDAGEWVKCVEVRAGKVIVRKLDQKPEVKDLDLGLDL